MTGFCALFRKELLQLFQSPIAYTVIAMLWVISGFLFSVHLLIVNTGMMVTAFHNLGLLLLLVTPLFTMRLFAEEARSGTMELLLSLPLADGAIVLAKYAAAQIVLLLVLAGSAATVLPLEWFGDPDRGPIIGGYLGMWLFGSAMFAVGLAISSVCENQVVAAMLTWGLLLFLWFVDQGAEVSDGWATTQLLRHLSLSLHHRDLIRGVLDSASVAYYVSLVGVSLVVTTQTLRWRRA